MKLRTCMALIVLLTLTASASFAQKIYWSDFGTDKIRRGDRDGIGSPEDLFDNTDGLSNPAGIALDVVAGKVYWADNVTNRIRRGNMDGTGTPEDLFSSVVASGLFPIDIALDVAAGKVYWADEGGARIRRANMDGTGSPENLFSGLSIPVGIALDISAGKIYWGDPGSSKIQRGNMNGTGSPEDLLGAGNALYIALDIAAGKVYWSTFGAIQRGNINGMGTPEVLFDSATDGVLSPLGIALDIAAGKVYWADFGQVPCCATDGRIQRGNMDGTGAPEDLFDPSDGLESAVGIALDFSAGVGMPAADRWTLALAALALAAAGAWWLRRHGIREE